MKTLLVALAAASFALVACGGGAAKTDTPAGDSTATPPAETAAPAETTAPADTGAAPADTAAPAN